MPYTYNDKTVNPINYDVTDVVKMNTFNEKEYKQQIAILEAYISKLDREIEDVETRIESRRPKDKWHELAIQKYIDTGDMSGIAEYERFVRESALREKEIQERKDKEQKYKDQEKQSKIDELRQQYYEAVNNTFAAKSDYDSTHSANDKAEYDNWMMRAREYKNKLDALDADYEEQSLPENVNEEQSLPDEDDKKSNKDGKKSKKDDNESDEDDKKSNKDGKKSNKDGKKSSSSYEEIAAQIKNLFPDERFKDDAAKQKAVKKAEELWKQLPDTYEKKIELRNLINNQKKRDSKATVDKKKAEEEEKKKKRCEMYGFCE